MGGCETASKVFEGGDDVGQKQTVLDVENEREPEAISSADGLDTSDVYRKTYIEDILRRHRERQELLAKQQAAQAKEAKQAQTEIAKSEVKPRSMPAPLKAEDKDIEPADVEPAVVEAAVVKADKPVQASSTGANVKKIRTGTHSDKTRIVLDLTDAAEFQTSFESGGKRLRVMLQGAGSQLAYQQEVLDTKLLKGYRVEQSDSGLAVVFDLKKASKLIYDDYLSPSDTYGHRVVVDIGAQ